MVTRIRQLLDTKQLTPTQFADFIGVGRPVMSHILSERNKPSLEVVQRIISAFPEVSLPWLLSGVGEMLSEATSAAPAIPPSAEFQEAAASVPSTAAPIEQEEPIIAGEAAEPEAPQPQLPSASIPQEPVEAALVAPVASSAPALVAPVAPRAFTAAAAPQAFAAGLQPLPAAPASVVTASLATPVLPAASVTQPFRAARFVPAAGVPAAAPRKSTVADLPTLEAAVPAPTPNLASTVPPAADKPLASLNPVPAAGTPVPGAMLPFLGEPGKEIRRIVIFYRDGSFADYQPEA